MLAKALPKIILRVRRLINTGISTPQCVLTYLIRLSKTNLSREVNNERWKKLQLRAPHNHAHNVWPVRTDIWHLRPAQGNGQHFSRNIQLDMALVSNNSCAWQAGKKHVQVLLKVYFFDLFFNNNVFKLQMRYIVMDIKNIIWWIGLIFILIFAAYVGMNISNMQNPKIIERLLIASLVFGAGITICAVLSWKKQQPDYS